MVTFHTHRCHTIKSEWKRVRNATWKGDLFAEPWGLAGGCKEEGITYSKEQRHSKWENGRKKKLQK